MRAERAGDALAVLLAVLLALAATFIGVRTGWHPADADEIVFRDTLVAMRHGEGFYQAQRDALIVKERRPPTSVRAIRPPTMYLLLRWFPPSSWRWLVGFVYLADLLLVWRLARLHGPPAALVAVGLAGVWVLGFASFLFLHAEVWGLPFFLGALLCVQARRVWAAVALFVVAASIRELYVVGLLIGAAAPLLLPWPPTRRDWAGRYALARPWLTGLVAAGALYAVHAQLARRVLSAQGYNARFGNEHRTVAFLLRLVAPISSGPGELFGVAIVVLGVVGTLRVVRRDAAAGFVVLSSVSLLLASVWATRTYWSACWAVPLAAYVPVAVVSPGGSDVRQQRADHATNEVVVAQ